GADGDVTVGDHADHAIVLGGRQRPGIDATHDEGGLLDGVVGGHEGDIAAHDVIDFHVVLLCLYRRQCRPVCFVPVCRYPCHLCGPRRRRHQVPETRHSSACVDRLHQRDRAPIGGITGFVALTAALRIAAASLTPEVFRPLTAKNGMNICERAVEMASATAFE